MTDPRPEHVDALAALIDHRLLSNPASRESTATTILTTTDPAALDAMEDALVRAGRLDATYGYRDPDGGVWQPGLDLETTRLHAPDGNPVVVRHWGDWREVR